MPKIPPYNGFELGPIRPPSEAYSLLLRINRGCGWNKCRFCGFYRDVPFSIRRAEDVKKDIDLVKYCVDVIQNRKPPRRAKKIAGAGVLGLGPAPSKRASALPNLLDIFPRRDGFYPQERPLKGSLVFIAGLFGHRQHIPLSRVEVLLGLLHAE